MSRQLVLTWDPQVPPVNGDTPPIYQHPAEALSVPAESKFRRAAQTPSQPLDEVPRGTHPSIIEGPSPPSKYIYYRLYRDHTSVPSNHPYDPSTPFLGRIDRQELAPPRSVMLLKRFIANVEELDLNRITAIYMSGDDETPAQDSMSVVRAAGNPGSSVENPIAVIITNESTSTVVAPALNVIPTTAETNESILSDSLSISRITSLSSRPSMRSTTSVSSSSSVSPNSEPAMARWRRSRVKSSAKPEGWLTGQTRQTPHLYEFSPPGRSLRKHSVGPRLPTGTPIYIHPEVIYYDRSPLHRVIVPSDKRLGYLSPNEIKFEEVMDIVPDGGNGWRVVIE